ncbi:unnamed protein product [Vitrella brassicaformis CCMP3155]|uniref:Uncharacterized protein n=1 Tax=Vitrella brassicaformis (strain CCMP3155) TaxID=1169540 RepID=A0A0G4EXS9_VITBC|nr:unnamed protein product [Vitrella brassicaformis CCMP3155]|eukprot:CEM03419.1 unnamed protein product [Vitrella brassicaformis CCMP3155]
MSAPVRVSEGDLDDTLLYHIWEFISGEEIAAGPAAVNARWAALADPDTSAPLWRLRYQDTFSHLPVRTVAGNGHFHPTPAPSVPVAAAAAAAAAASASGSASSPAAGAGGGEGQGEAGGDGDGDAVTEWQYREAYRRAAELCDLTESRQHGGLVWGMAKYTEDMGQDQAMDMERECPKIWIESRAEYLYAYGGWSSSGGPCNDLWRLPLPSLLSTGEYSWSACRTHNTPPPPSYGQSVTPVFDINKPLNKGAPQPPDRLFVNGGYLSGGYRNESDGWGVLEMAYLDGKTDDKPSDTKDDEAASEVKEYRSSRDTSFARSLAFVPARLSGHSRKGRETEPKDRCLTWVLGGSKAAERTTTTTSGGRMAKSSVPGRAFHSATYVPFSSKKHREGYIFIFGGNENSQPVNTSVIVDVATWQWHTGAAEVSGVPPAPRNSHSATLVQSRYVFVIGGANGRDVPRMGQDFEDLHLFDGHTKTWIAFDDLPWVSKGLQPTFAIPESHKRCLGRAHTAVLAGQKIILFGGHRGGCRELVVFNTATGRLYVPVMATNARVDGMVKGKDGKTPAASPAEAELPSRKEEASSSSCAAAAAAAAPPPPPAACAPAASAAAAVSAAVDKKGQGEGGGDGGTTDRKRRRDSPDMDTDRPLPKKGQTAQRQDSDHGNDDEDDSDEEEWVAPVHESEDDDIDEDGDDDDAYEEIDSEGGWSDARAPDGPRDGFAGAAHVTVYKPRPRSFHASVWTGHNMVTYGGWSPTGGTFSDVHVLSVIDSVTEEEILPVNAPDVTAPFPSRFSRDPLPARQMRFDRHFAPLQVAPQELLQLLRLMAGQPRNDEGEGENDDGDGDDDDDEDEMPDLEDDDERQEASEAQPSGTADAAGLEPSPGENVD